MGAKALGALGLTTMLGFVYLSMQADSAAQLQMNLPLSDGSPAAALLLRTTLTRRNPAKQL